MDQERKRNEKRNHSKQQEQDQPIVKKQKLSSVLVFQNKFHELPEDFFNKYQQQIRQEKQSETQVNQNEKLRAKNLMGNMQNHLQKAKQQIEALKIRENRESEDLDQLDRKIQIHYSNLSNFYFTKTTPSIMWLPNQDDTKLFQPVKQYTKEYIKKRLKGLDMDFEKEKKKQNSN